MNDMSIACFLSVARTGSFTASARELFGTQQAVSRNIQGLEEELGFTLLDRSGRTVELTWEGTRFLQWCQEYDRQFVRTVGAAKRLMGETINLLHFGWCDWTGCPETVAAGLRKFSEKNRECTVDFLQGSVGEIKRFLAEGLADIAVLPEFVTHDLPESSVSVPFMEEPLFAVTGKEPVFRGEMPEIAELVAVKRLAARMENESDEAVRERSMRMCAGTGIYPEHLEIMPNVWSVYSELACGPCYTVAPKTDYALRRDGLRFYPLSVSVPLVFVYPKESLTPWGQLLETFLREGAAKE